MSREMSERTQPIGLMASLILIASPLSFVCDKSGVNRALLAACEGWAREMGCCEFASDCELINSASHAFHMKLGFMEANRIICFTKKL